MALPEIIRQLLENGVHFGHLSKHWNPKMGRFIFGKKKNVYVIDLEKTAEKLEEAKEFVKTTAKRDGKILFVTTKKQVRYLVRELAVSCDMPYVVERWVGGFLTNFSTVRGRVQRYIKLMERRDSGDFDKLSGKEVARLNRQIQRMEKNYSGVTSLDKFPKCVFVVDPKREVACVKEANRLSIPVVALIDTDANPDVVDYPIPGNDDAIKSVGYIVSQLVEAIKQGQAAQVEIAKEEAKKESESAQPAEAEPPAAGPESAAGKQVKED